MPSHYQHRNAIVSTDWLAEHMADPELRAFECTTYLDYLPPGSDAPYRVVSGRAHYAQGHIPGAGFLDIQNELSDQTSANHLRFTMLPPDRLAELLGRRGIGDGSRVVLYSRDRHVWATRVWWMLRSIGFDAAAVLDGGWEKWVREGRPTSVDEPVFAPAVLTARPRAGVFVGKDAVAVSMDDSDACLINALDPELHSGANPRYGRRGRIPGSVNIPSVSLVDPDTHTFVSATEATAAFQRVGADPSRRTVVYCGGGIAATLDAFLLHQLGYEDVSVYDASMSEWARDEALPMESDF